MIKITNEQALQLQGYEIANNWLCHPVQDINNDWFIGNLEAEAIGISGEESEYIAVPSEEPVIFHGYALIPTESIMQTYPELPYEQDANGTTVIKWDIVYDDTYNYALPALLTLEKIKYKPIP